MGDYWYVTSRRNYPVGYDVKAGYEEILTQHSTKEACVQVIIKHCARLKSRESFRIYRVNNHEIIQEDLGTYCPSEEEYMEACLARSEFDDYAIAK